MLARRGERGTVVSRRRGVSPWRPAVLPAHGRWARVVLVQSGACLLDGDDLAVSIEVGAGAWLEVLELGATVVNRARGPGARLRVEISLAAEARLAWPAAPLVVSAGAVLDREIRLSMRPGARALLRDTVVLGRHDQPPGAARLGFRAELAGEPLLHERLDTSDRGLLGSPLLMGEDRVLDTTLLLGCTPPEPVLGMLALAGPGALVRGRGATAVAAGEAPQSAWERWTGSLQRCP